jgi:fatty-acyl-CoA synthase
MTLLPQPPAALLSSEVTPAPPYDTLVAALDTTGGPPITFHGLRDAPVLARGDVRDLAWRWSALLRAQGVGRGERVLILLRTGPGFVGALLGAMLAGAIPVPLASPMSFGSLDRYLANLAAIVADCGARCLVTDDRVLRALGERPALGVGIVLTEADLAAAPTAPRSLPSVSGADTALLQYTSGTTGRPKGAVISHRALVHNAFAIAHGLGVSADDVGVSWLPLFHDMGLIGVLLTAVCHPYPLHLMPPEAFLMRPGRWLRTLAEVGGTLSAAPNFAYALCAAKAEGLDGARLDRWRHALNGAEPVLAHTCTRFAERFAPDGFTPGAMTPVYGLAESTLAVTFPAPGRGVETLDARALHGDVRAPAEAVSVGRPVAGTTMGVFDGQGGALAAGRVGEVRVAGPSRMDGYFRNEAASAEALDGAWLKTGDLGFVHDGALYLVGRAKEMIVKGGRNLFPQDLERVAAEVRGVRAGSVAAFGRHNRATGTDDLVLVIESAEPDAETRAGLVREVRGALLAALDTKPDAVHLWPVGSIPRTTSGKLQRRACAARLDAQEGT